MNKRYIVTYLLIWGALWATPAQSSWKNRLYLEGNFHYGFVTPHLEYISYFITDHIAGYQLNVGFQTNGEKAWQQHYNYPKIGIGLYHSGLGNDQVYGKMNALFCYMDRYFIRGNPRFNIGNSINFGLAFVTKKYDFESNYFDMAIGSKLNAYINYTINATARISAHCNARAGLGVIHASNGNYQEPNKGMNLFTVFGGVQYTLHDQKKLELIFNSPPRENRRNNILLMGAFGRKQLNEQFNQKYTPLAISGEYSRQLTQTSLVGSSINMYYDPSLKRKIELLNDTASTSDMVRVSLHLSYELKMGRLSYVIQPGVYLKNSYSNSGIITNRIGIRYQLTPGLVAGITIKAHWTAIADFIEWGIGYRFKY